MASINMARVRKEMVELKDNKDGVWAEQVSFSLFNGHSRLASRLATRCDISKAT